jgi:hypothetical protein
VFLCMTTLFSEAKNDHKGNDVPKFFQTECTFILYYQVYLTSSNNEKVDFVLASVLNKSSPVIKNHNARIDFFLLAVYHHLPSTEECIE